MDNNQNEKKLPQFIFVTGGPGSGKSTHCNLLKSKYNYHHISTGDLLRFEQESGSFIARQYITKDGQFHVSDLLMNLIETFMNNDQSSTSNVYLLDGFPRFNDNLISWDKYFKEKVLVLGLIYFECSPEFMKVRISNRAQTNEIKRNDDRDEIVQQRIDTFLKESLSVIETFSGKIVKIDAENTKEEVQKQIDNYLLSLNLI